MGGNFEISSGKVAVVTPSCIIELIGIGPWLPKFQDNTTCTLGNTTKDEKRENGIFVLLTLCVESLMLLIHLLLFLSV